MAGGVACGGAPTAAGVPPGPTTAAHEVALPRGHALERRHLAHHPQQQVRQLRVPLSHACQPLHQLRVAVAPPVAHLVRVENRPQTSSPEYGGATTLEREIGVTKRQRERSPTRNPGLMGSSWAAGLGRQ